MSTVYENNGLKLPLISVHEPAKIIENITSRQMDVLSKLDKYNVSFNFSCQWEVENTFAEKNRCRLQTCLSQKLTITLSTVTLSFVCNLNGTKQIKQ